jgi:sigma-B regulation protein RsbU (phosphoserine phosphatase)
MVEQAIGEQKQREMLAAFERIDQEATRREAREASREIAGRLADRFGVPRTPLRVLEEDKSCQCWLYDELAKQKRIVERQNFAMTRDLEMARQVQRALIPRASFHVPGLEIAFDYQPVVQVGGDVLDVVPLSGNRVLLFVGDVVGHGVGAALTMSAVKAALLSAVKTDPHPESVLAEINKVVADMFGDHGIPQFVTAACCLVDPEGARAEIAIAGHPRPLWLRARAGEVVQAGESGLPLGIVESGEHPRTCLALEPGDALLLYTDGLVEAFDPNRRLYGYPRFMNVVLRNSRSNAAELAEMIRRDLDAHRNGHVLIDDLALLVVKLRSELSPSPV